MTLGGLWLFSGDGSLKAPTPALPMTSSISNLDTREASLGEVWLGAVRKVEGVAALWMMVLRLSLLSRLAPLGVLPEVADELLGDRLLSLWPLLELLFLVNRRGAGFSCASVKSVRAGDRDSSTRPAEVGERSGLELGIGK